MKTLVPLFALILFAMPAVFRAQAAVPPAESSAERVPPQRVRLEVLRVFTARDGDAIFRAYLVKWKDQEVIVSDPLARSNYREGEMITVLVMNHPYPRGQEPHRLLGFTIVPEPR